MGVLMRRFIGRLLMTHVARDPVLLQYLLPHQLAVGVSGGAEAIIHMVRELTNVVKYEDYVVIRLGASNAFNSISRQHRLEAVTAHCPGIARWIHFLYGSESILFFGSHVILSRNGTQQGDPPGMVLFALALHPIILELQQQMDLPLLEFYTDDGSLIVPHDKAPDVISFLQARGSRIGFVLNLIKTDIWWFTTPVIPRIQCTINTARAVPILGLPIGHQDGCIELLRERRQSHEDLLAALPALQNPQIAYHLFRSCASACLFIYSLRTTPPHLTRAEAINFDQRQRRVFEEIHRPFSEDAWQTVTLPTEDGGLELVPTEVQVETAYVASLLNAWGVLKTLAHAAAHPISVIQRFHTSAIHYLQVIMRSLPEPHQTDSTAILARAEDKGRIIRYQDEVAEHIYNNRSNLLMPPPTTTISAEKLKRARLLPSATIETAKVFTTLPSSFLGTRIEPEVWKTMVDLRAGNPLFDGNRLCPQCLVGSSRNIRRLDELGMHAATCPGGFGTTRRHNSVCQYLYTRLRKSGVSLATYREKPLASDANLPTQDQRRMDIVIDDLDFDTRPYGMVVTMVSPHNHNYLTKAASMPGGAAIEAERLKHLKYDAACHSEGKAFSPLENDVFGAIGANTRAALWKLATHLSRLRGTSPKAEYAYKATPTVSRAMQATAVAINRRRLSASPLPALQ